MKQSTLILGVVGAFFLFAAMSRPSIPSRPTSGVDVNDMRGGGFRVKDEGQGKSQADAAERAAEQAERDRLARLGVVDRATVDSALDVSTSPTDFFSSGPAMGW